MKLRIPLIGGHNQPGLRVLDDQLCVNWMPETDASGKAALVPAPGYSLLAAAGPGPLRSNGVKWKGDCYFVSGSKLVKVDSEFKVTEIGELITSQGYACIAAGFNFIAIVDGASGYCYDGTTFEEITDEDLPISDFVEWIDKYYIYTQRDTGNFYVSKLQDPRDIGGLDYENAESRPDNLKRGIEHGGDLLLIGEYSSELWNNVGDPFSPWQPYIGSVYPWGTGAPHSVAKLGGWLYVLARVEDGGHSIIKTASAQAVKISTPALDKEISGLDYESAFGCAYEYEGRGFYKLVFPKDKKIFIYEDGEGVWHERRIKEDAIIPLGHVYFGGKHIFGDYRSHKLYEMAHGVYTDDGSEITRVRRIQRIEAEGHPMTIHSVELQMEPGVGLATGQGEDPLIWMRYSFDGGYKWSQELYGTPGKMGDYENRLVFRKLGTGPMLSLEFGASDPVNWTLVAAWADVTIGK
ncbi:MAG: hypothetical protein OEZ32_14555 [Nitrospinota bacterium]|nr:hypothetical protein [Nitrospinota bacterium]